MTRKEVDNILEITKLISDLGFPIASNIILVYVIYRIMTFYTDKLSKMSEDIAVLSVTINENTRAIYDLKEVIKGGEK